MEGISGDVSEVLATWYCGVLVESADAVRLFYVGLLCAISASGLDDLIQALAFPVPSEPSGRIKLCH